jgi:hypothetical protein
VSQDTMQGAMHIGLAAPWGIGKTSVVAALLDEANEVLAGTPVSVEAAGPTRKRLNQLNNEIRSHLRAKEFVPGGQLNNEIRGHLRAKEFVPGGMRGTQEISLFSLDIHAVGTEKKFTLEIMDYPGGLLDSQEGEQWEQVKRWLRQADVLMLPIDAALLMEAVTPKHHRQLEEVLNISEMEALASREWAKQRVHGGRGPGTLVLVPVKCETYFADNGGTADRSMRLYERVMDRYGPVVSAVVREAADTRVVYCPVDTLGCVEVVRVEWSKDGVARPQSHYRVRGQPTLSRRGAADLFVMLVDQMLSAAQGEQADRAQETREIADMAHQAAEQDLGGWGNFWAWLSGARKEARQHAAALGAEASREQEALAALVRTLEEIRKRPLSGRSRTVGR